MTNHRNLLLAFSLFIPILVIPSTHASSTEVALNLDENSQHYRTLSPEKSEILTIISSSKTKRWYFWAFSCSGNVDLSIATRGRRIDDAHSIKKGHGYFYQGNSMKEVPTKTFTLSKGSDQEGDSEIFISSGLAYHPYLNHGLERDLWQKSRFKYEKSRSKVVVEMSLAKFLGAREATEKVIYDVRLCPYNSGNSEDQHNFCKKRAECRHYQANYTINEEKAMRPIFDGVEDGEYYVQISATLEHKGQMVRFVTYPVESLTVEELFRDKWRNNWWKILIGFDVLVILIAMCLKKFEKHQQSKERTKFEIQMFDKGYNVLGEGESFY